MRAGTHIAYGNPKRITSPATNFLRPAVGALGLVVGLMALGAAPPAAAQPRYTITDLGTLGGSFSAASGINNLGQVAGTSTTASGRSHGFRTAPNSPINPATDDLGTLGGCFSSAFGINSSGQVVGQSTNVCVGGSGVAFRTAPNNPINPATDSLGIRAFDSTAYGINDSGPSGWFLHQPQPRLPGGSQQRVQSGHR